MKKSISFLLAVMIFVSMFVAVPTFAATDMVTYEHIDISGAATGKFWVNINDTAERTKANYSQTGFTDRHYDTDFFVDGDKWEVVVQWPASFYTANYAPTGTLSGKDTINPIITSKSGVSYKMPTKTSTFANGKESINIIAHNADVEIPIGKQYDKINFLTASACLGTTTSPKKVMTVKVKYEGEEAIATPITNEPVLGRTAYNTVDNFVGVLSTLGVANGGTSFGTNNGTNKLALYEYSIDVDESKVVQSIIVTVNWQGTEATGNRTTFSIPAITGVASVPEYATEFTKVDLTAYANGKFYVDHTTEEADYAYAKTDLFIGDRLTSDKSSVSWPLALHTRNNSIYPNQAAIITSDDTATPEIASLKSGVPYQMPTKRSGLSEKEAIIFNAYGSGLLDNWGTIRQKTINITGNYSALHFLMGRSGHNGNVRQVYVEAHYSDGSVSKLGTGEKDGSYGPAGVIVPSAVAADQMANDNFVADLVSGFNTQYQGQPKYAPLNADSHYGAENRICLYEYTLELDPSKTLTKIIFYDGMIRVSGVNKYSSTALVSLTLEAPSEERITNAFSAGKAIVEEGSCSATVVSPYKGKAILAVYDDDRLVGANVADITESTHWVTIKVENENISDIKDYRIQAMLWKDMQSLTPIAHTVNVK